MMTIIKTNSTHPDFVNLVKALDADLAIRDGDEHDFYDQFNKIDKLQYTIVGYLNDEPVGCGAIRPFDNQQMEVKRMYVDPKFRGNGLASQLLRALEDWALELGYPVCVLETGIRQPEAIRLYEKNHYQRIPNYPPYEKMANSVCFRKELRF